MTAESSGAPRDGELAPVSILLVDDDETWARTNARVLERQREAFRVETAADAASAAAAYADLDPDCVVCDYRLERTTGLDVLEAVRDDDPDRPFVLVTGEGSEAVASEAIGRRVTDYVRKSAVAERTELLARQVERAVRAHRTRLALERERRSKDAMLDIVRATTTRQDLAADFCRHLVAERGYASAWLGTYSPGEGVHPESVAGEERYLEAVYSPGTVPGDGDEPALVALAEERPCVVADIDADVAADLDAAPDALGPATWEAVAAACGFSTAAAVPVDHDGAVVGVLAVYARADAAVDASERALLADYGETIGFALRTAEWKQSLLAGSPVTAEFSVRDASIPLVALQRTLPAGARLTVRTAVLRSESTLLYVADVEGASPDAIEAATAAVDGVDLAETHDRGATVQCELLVVRPTPERVLVDAGGRFVESVVEDDAARVSVASHARETISALEAELDDRYDTVAVTSIQPTRSTASGTGIESLTDKQRGALELAYFDGYFERPRRNNATEIADKLGISRATFAQHVRSAERKLLGDVIEGDE